MRTNDQRASRTELLVKVCMSSVALCSSVWGFWYLADHRLPAPARALHRAQSCADAMIAICESSRSPVSSQQIMATQACDGTSLELQPLRRVRVRVSWIDWTRLAVRETEASVELSCLQE